VASSVDRRTFLAAITASVPAVLAAKAADQDNQAIARLMNVFADAERRYDKAAVSSMLDKNFVYVGNDGSLTRRADFIRLTDRVVNPIDVLDVTNIEVYVRGDTAIAIGLVHEKGAVDGRGYEFKGRTLNTFSRRTASGCAWRHTTEWPQLRIHVKATNGQPWPISDRRLRSPDALEIAEQTEV
jgi:ketosteroid isomerase-like protein